MALSPTEIQLTLSHCCLYLHVDTGITSLFSLLASDFVCAVVQIMYGYVSAFTGCLLARPFASILNRAAPLGLCCLPELLPNVCKWACPQWCPQLHAVGQRQRTRRPSLSSVTPDPLSVTRHVHPNTGPHQRTMSPPSPDTHSPQLFSIHTDEPLAWLFGALDRVSRSCSDMVTHIPPPCRWLLNLC